MSEQDLRLLRLAGFAVAMAVALAWQKLSPHAGVPGSTRVNAGLWLVNLVVTGTICGACVCDAARWATQHDRGLFNRVVTPSWVALPVTAAVLDLVSYGWHRANHVVRFLWRWHKVHHSDTAF